MLIFVVDIKCLQAARKRDALLAKADQGDLIQFGMVPELVGRFPVIVPFHSFDLNVRKISARDFI